MRERIERAEEWVGGGQVHSGVSASSPTGVVGAKSSTFFLQGLWAHIGYRFANSDVTLIVARDQQGLILVAINHSTPMPSSEKTDGPAVE